MSIFGNSKKTNEKNPAMDMGGPRKDTMICEVIEVGYLRLKVGLEEFTIATKHVSKILQETSKRSPHRMSCQHLQEGNFSICQSDDTIARLELMGDFFLIPWELG